MPNTGAEKPIRLTDRLSLRVLSPADAPHLNRVASQERASRFATRVPRPYPPDGADVFIGVAGLARAPLDIGRSDLGLARLEAVWFEIDRARWRGTA
jgi:hypothetical protein